MHLHWSYMTKNGSKVAKNHAVIARPKILVADLKTVIFHCRVADSTHQLFYCVKYCAYIYIHIYTYIYIYIYYIFRPLNYPPPPSIFIRPDINSHQFDKPLDKLTAINRYMWPHWACPGACSVNWHMTVYEYFGFGVFQ